MEYLTFVDDFVLSTLLMELKDGTNMYFCQIYVFCPRWPVISILFICSSGHTTEN